MFIKPCDLVKVDHEVIVVKIGAKDGNIFFELRGALEFELLIV